MPKPGPPRVFYDDFDLSKHMPGDYMSGAFSQMIYSIARFSGAKVIVEVGVWKGLTASLLVQAAHMNTGHCWGIDRGECKDEAKRRIDRLGLAHCWTYIQSDSAKAGQTWEHGPIDFLMIDAGHEYPEVVADRQAWIPHVKPGGYVFFHDYLHHMGAGVYRAVNEFIEEVRAENRWQYVPLHWEHGAMLMRKKGRGE